jgi:hypothetical protein
VVARRDEMDNARARQDFSPGGATRMAIGGPRDGNWQVGQVTFIASRGIGDRRQTIAL